MPCFYYISYRYIYKILNNSFKKYSFYINKGYLYNITSILFYLYECSPGFSLYFFFFFFSNNSSNLYYF
jgi:hypothetical protein